MSKSSQSTNFRKVNVDELDEERYQDDAGESVESSGPTEGEIQNLLNSKKHVEALSLLLKDPPFNAGKEAKAARFALVLRVLTQFKSGEIDATLKGFAGDDVDNLLKFIYRGFSEPTDSSCSTLLTWHEKVVAVGGPGSIMRVMTDRKAL